MQRQQQTNDSDIAVDRRLPELVSSIAHWLSSGAKRIQGTKGTLPSHGRTEPVSRKAESSVVPPHCCKSGRRHRQSSSAFCELTLTLLMPVSANVWVPVHRAPSPSVPPRCRYPALGNSSRKQTPGKSRPICTSIVHQAPRKPSTFLCHAIVSV